MCFGKKHYLCRAKVETMKNLLVIFCVLLLVGCGHRGPSAAELRRTEKHLRDSVALIEQQRSLEYYQSQFDRIVPQVDSLLLFFKYEKNEKYQDHGYYVATGRNGLRVMVRDDGQPPILMYRNGQRIDDAEDEAVLRARDLLTLIHDTNELEQRILRTSLEIAKYQKRLDK